MINQSANSFSGILHIFKIGPADQLLSLLLLFECIPHHWRNYFTPPIRTLALTQIVEFLPKLDELIFVWQAPISFFSC